MQRGIRAIDTEDGCGPRARRVQAEAAGVAECIEHAPANAEAGDRLAFISQSGVLRVFREVDGLLALDFPALVPTELGVTPELERALRVSPVDALAADKLLVLLESEQAVRDCKPDLAAIARLPWQGVIVTARGQEVDFVSRFFAPAVGVDEDPVTGSAHCSLTPYWAHRLGKAELVGRQISQRGGTVYCKDTGERVLLGGYCVEYLVGSIQLPDR